MKSHPFKIHGAMVLVGLLYGANYTIAKIAMPQFIGPSAFILLRLLAAGILFWLFHAFFIKERIRELKDFFTLALCGLFGMAANMLMFFEGLSRTSPVNGSLVMTISPITVLLLSALILKERLSWWKVLGISLGMAGAVLQILDPTGLSKELSEVNWIGDLLILLNAISYSIYLVVAKPLLGKYHPITVVKWAFLFGFLMTLPFGIGELREVVWSEMDWKIGGSIAYVLVGTTFLVYLLNAWTLKQARPSLVGTYIYLQPVLAVTVAVFIAGYPWNNIYLLYAALIFSGVYLVSRK